MKTIAPIAVLLLLAGSPLAGAGEEKKVCEAEAMECAQAIYEHIQHRGWVGLELDHDAATGALKVEKVIAESPASEAGFRPGDVLVAADGLVFAEASKEAMEAYYKSMVPGKTVRFRVDRDGRQVDLDVELVPVPPQVAAQWIGQHMLQHLERAAETAGGEQVAGKDDRP